MHGFLNHISIRFYVGLFAKFLSPICHRWSCAEDEDQCCQSLLREEGGIRQVAFLKSTLPTPKICKLYSGNSDLVSLWWYDHGCDSATHWNTFFTAKKRSQSWERGQYISINPFLAIGTTDMTRSRCIGSRVRCKLSGRRPHPGLEGKRQSFKLRRT